MELVMESSIHILSFRSIPVERRNDIRPSASQLDSTIHDVMILLECREIERSGNETAGNAGRLTDSVDLIRVHTF